MVTAEIWHTANGADESIFIQDQSLPLRLAAHSKNMLYLDEVIYCFARQIRTTCRECNAATP